MKLSVNILNWNCWDTLEHTLALLGNELVYLDHEIIVVDNGSTDVSREKLEAIKPKWDTLRYIFNDENMGISIGKNQAIKKSKGEYIFMLDADVLPVKNSILLLVKYLDEHPECHAIGMYPNKWTTDKNNHVKYHEDYCNVLFEPTIRKTTCLYYGIYRRTIFDSGVMMCEEDDFGEPGYGWEDHDFYMQMKEKGFDQWQAHINNELGRYHHAINSSIRVMGRDKYMDSSRKRNKVYKRRWPK